jgi:hypothetical protein
VVKIHVLGESVNQSVYKLLCMYAWVLMSESECIEDSNYTVGSIGAVNLCYYCCQFVLLLQSICVITAVNLCYYCSQFVLLLRPPLP